MRHVGVSHPRVKRPVTQAALDRAIASARNEWVFALDADERISEQLKRELDALKALGVDNLRVLGASERSPLKNSLQPAFHERESLNEDLLGGLDFLLAEMSARDSASRAHAGRWVPLGPTACTSCDGRAAEVQSVRSPGPRPGQSGERQSHGGRTVSPL